jgi:hypothetical protein
MVRSGYGRHAVVATGSDSGDQVSVNAWNDDINDAGMLGFTASTKTISAGAITPVDTVTVVAAESGTADNLDFITYSETNANDIFYLFADAGDTITVRHNQSPSAGDAAIITTSAANVTLSETIPLVLQRRGTTLYQIIENSISSVTAGSTTTFTNKTINAASNTITVTASDVSDFDTEVANNTAVTANTAKVTNATHTGDVTGSTALTIAAGAVDDAMLSGSITPSKVTGTAAILGANTFTADQDIGGFDVDNVQNVIHDFSTTTTGVDFTADEFQDITISANTTFTGSNYAIGKSKTIVITTDSTLRTLTFPSGWTFIGAKPTEQAASKIGVLTLTCRTGAESGVIASYGVQE